MIDKLPGAGAELGPEIATNLEIALELEGDARRHAARRRMGGECGRKVVIPAELGERHGLRLAGRAAPGQRCVWGGFWGRNPCALSAKRCEGRERRMPYSGVCPR